jgi:ubiquinone/menaquinone biosynthesis C-methylase UbiE
VIASRNGTQPVRIERGTSTAFPIQVDYRLGKLDALRLGRGRWLDCGCAGGEYTLALGERNADFTVGVDVELDRVGLALRLAGSRSKIRFGCATTENLPFRDGSFDGVLLNEVLEHVADEERSLNEIYRVLVPGGTLALMSPNRLFPVEGHGMIIGKTAIDVSIPLLPWLPARIASRFMRARNYWPGELRRMVSEAGFSVVSVTSLFPVFERYPLLPRRITTWYRNVLPWLERIPGVRRCGLSTFIVARRPGAHA